MHQNGYLPRTNTIEATILSPTGHDLSVLDVDAVRAVTRLIDRGYEAYLVGGCVRDLLLGRTPKDYDIATGARPQQVKRTFPRNCRIIGRRFKLAHLHFHRNTKILECSTFRRNPQNDGEGDGEPEDLLITRDNEFGSAEEDALRRDFTINALFLDPTTDKIVDHVDGLADVEARVIRTIGDPVVRFREDPVRILRAAKFAGRLGFTVEKQTLAAMAETAEDLVRAAPPRVLEEILRLLRSGHALESFQLLRDVDAIRYLVPVVGRFLDESDDAQRGEFWALLEALDERVRAQPSGAEPPPNGVLLAVLMYGAVAAEAARKDGRSASSIAEELLGSLATDLRLPRRDSGCLKRVCGVQHRFAQDEDKRRFRLDSFVRSPYFAEALQLFELRAAAAGDDPEVAERWRTLAGIPSDGPFDDDDDELMAEDEAPRKKRRRRRRRRRDDDDDDRPARAEDGDASGDRDDDEREDADDSDSDDAPSDDDRAETEEAPRKKRRRRRRGRRDDDESHDAPIDEPREAAEATDEDDADEAVAEAPTGRKKLRAPKRKARAPADEDISDVTFPSSEEPAPHGDPIAPARAAVADDDDEEDDDERFPLDRGNPNARDDEDEDDDVDEPEARDDDDRDEDRDDEDDEGRRPKRRRRRRRRRASARDDDRDEARDDREDDGARDDDDDNDEADDDEAVEARGDEDGDERRPRRRRRGRRGRGRGRRDGDGDDRASGDRASGDRASSDRGGDDKSTRQKPREQQKPKDRGKKKRDRDRDRRGKKGGKGPARDVDVVPRYRDRRGKVEVIEPVNLDLSAFDVELDPKRVPTFGSIVEGKGRPKRRGPRMPDERGDEYRPPPPPGGDDAPSAPPPPPASDDSDTFGDW